MLHSTSMDNNSYVNLNSFVSPILVFCYVAFSFCFQYEWSIDLFEFYFFVVLEKVNMFLH